MSDSIEPTAEITALALRKAATAAEQRHAGLLDELRDAFIARATRTRHGLLRRLYTVADAERHWPEDHSHIGCFMGPKVFEAPRKAHNLRHWKDRAAALHRLATTSSLHNIRIPERDVQFLRPYLNGEHDA